VKPDERGAEDAAGKLRRQVGSHGREMSRAHRENQRNRWIEVRIIAPASDGGEDPSHYGERPSRSDDRPAATFGFRTLQQHAGDNTIPKKYQHHRPQEFTKDGRSHAKPPLGCRA
jgi:hypothetical protein